MSEWSTIDTAFDVANSQTEDDRIAAVTGVRDGLVDALSAADGEWGTALTGAGTALGTALDGIADFDWQHVRDYVGAVSGARQAAEIGALTAQVGFVSIYYGAMNSYNASLATATVAHATAYAQSTADYYVGNANAAATAAEAELATAVSSGASASVVAAEKEQKKGPFEPSERRSLRIHSKGCISPPARDTTGSSPLPLAASSALSCSVK